MRSILEEDFENFDLPPLPEVDFDSSNLCAWSKKHSTGLDPNY